MRYMSFVPVLGTSRGELVEKDKQIISLEKLNRNSERILRSMSEQSGDPAPAGLRGSSMTITKNYGDICNKVRR